jgi:hypothetical protein
MGHAVKISVPPTPLPPPKNFSICGADITKGLTKFSGSTSATEGISAVGVESRRRSNLTHFGSRRFIAVAE